MRSVALWAVVLLSMSALVACQQNPPAAEPGAAQPEQEQMSEPGVPELNIGDIEQTIHFNIELDEAFQTDSVTVEKKEDTMHRVRLVTVNVRPPYPETLPFNTLLRCRQPVSDPPVVLRGGFTLNGEKRIRNVAMVLWHEKERYVVLDPLDVVEFVGEPIPDSVLLTLDVEALLMPEGTDGDSLDPLEATVTPERSSTAITATAVRVNFLPQETPEGAEPEEG